MRIRTLACPSIPGLTAFVLPIFLLVAAPAAQDGAKKATPAPAAGKKPTGKVAERKVAAVPFAVVDMEKAAAETKAFKKGMAEGARRAAKYQKDLEAMKAEIKAMKLEIEMMVESPERLGKELERETLIGKLNLAGKMFNSELDRQKVRNDDRIYQELTDAIAELASRRGILLVLRKHPRFTIKEMLEKRMVRTMGDALSRQIRTNQQRSVIYHAPDLDLTEDLIKYLKAK